MRALSPDVVGRRVDDRFVVVNLRTNRIYELNRTASALWELLGSGADTSEVEAGMRERFEVEPEVLHGEIESAMNVLTQAGLVTS
jgi:hypothetical protein